jgi:predicted HD superfamily hydrolase involved in NAD metabolism
MNREQLMEAVQSQMPSKRWQHTLGVMQTAVQLAEQYGADPVKADLAAILHDVSKYWPIEKLEAIVREQNMPAELLLFDPQLLHAPVGAYVAEMEYGIHDGEVLDAIRYHTSGRERMTLLDKVVCLADYIEPGRDYPTVNEIRKLAESNLNQALIAGFDSTIQFLLQKGKRIFPLTVSARNDLIEQWRLQ